MTADANGQATITARYVEGGSAIILWNGFDIAAIAGLGGNTFADWIAGFDNLNGLTAFADDPDGEGDGIPNGIENYLGPIPENHVDSEGYEFIVQAY